MRESNIVTLNIRILGFCYSPKVLFHERATESRSVLNHLEVYLRYIRANNIPATAIDDCVVAFSFVLILDEPKGGVQIGRLVNTEASIELGYLINFLFQEESLVFLDFIFRSYDC